MSEYFIFVRRTPRALNMHVSTTRPVRVRKAGSQKVTIRSTEARGKPPAAEAVIKLIRELADRPTLAVDLEAVTQVALERGLHVEHLPGSGLFRECVHIIE